MTPATTVQLRNPRTVGRCRHNLAARLTAGGWTCSHDQPEPPEPRRPAGPAITATDGSVARTPIRLYGEWVFPTGWGYLSSDGRWGCGYCPQPKTVGGDNRPVVAELRAVWHAAGDTLRRQHVEVWVDSLKAIDYLDLWKTGNLRMPNGYRGSARHTPRLIVLARTVSAHPGNLTVRHVHGHRGQALNEAADRLAKLGRQWGEQQLTEAQVQARALWIAEQWAGTGRQREVAA